MHAWQPWLCPVTAATPLLLDPALLVAQSLLPYRIRSTEAERSSHFVPGIPGVDHFVVLHGKLVLASRQRHAARLEAALGQYISSIDTTYRCERQLVSLSPPSSSLAPYSCISSSSSCLEGGSLVLAAGEARSSACRLLRISLRNFSRRAMVSRSLFSLELAPREALVFFFWYCSERARSRSRPCDGFLDGLGGSAVSCARLFTAACSFSSSEERASAAGLSGSPAGEGARCSAGRTGGSVLLRVVLSADDARALIACLLRVLSSKRSWLLIGLRGPVLTGASSSSPKLSKDVFFFCLRRSRSGSDFRAAAACRACCCAARSSRVMRGAMSGNGLCTTSIRCSLGGNTGRSGSVVESSTSDRASALYMVVPPTRPKMVCLFCSSGVASSVICGEHDGRRAGTYKELAVVRVGLAGVRHGH